MNMTVLGCTPARTPARARACDTARAPGYTARHLTVHISGYRAVGLGGSRISYSGRKR